MRFVLTLFCLLALAACAPKQALPPASSLPLAPELADSLLERLRENAAAFRSLEGLAKVKVVTAGKSMTATQVVFAEKPDRLRAETLSPFGQPLLLLASDGKELTVLAPGEGTFYRGEASARNLHRLTRMPLQPADLVHLLLYQVPVIAYSSRDLAAAAEGGYLLTLRGGQDLRQELRFDRDQVLIGASYFAQGELELKVAYSQFGGPSRPWYPASSLLEMPGSSAEASLVFSEVKTNVDIPPGRFQITPPAGIEIRAIP